MKLLKDMSLEEAKKMYNDLYVEKKKKIEEFTKLGKSPNEVRMEVYGLDLFMRDIYFHTAELTKNY